MNAIVSVTRNWAIGLAGRLAVRNGADMRRFVRLTMGGTVIMGRRTLESFPGGPLEGRRNIVITGRPETLPDGVEAVDSPEGALDAASNDEPGRVWLIGGESVYRELIDACDRAYITKNDIVVPADSFFPNLDEDPGWMVASKERGGTTAQGIDFEYITYARMPKGCGPIR